ncbi:MAG TPA: twin-arginine translocation signal domain-containing protein, partial [Candidatus Angelobacter sp.]|nr:twin-arginine translocation signal domain-containing protein [Candidatus Angelobacter sp.]
MSTSNVNVDRASLLSTRGNHNGEAVEKKPGGQMLANPSRRSFLGKAGGLTAMAAAASLVPLEPLLGGKQSQAEASVITYKDNTRSNDAYYYRRSTANTEHIDIGVLPDNGDAAKFSDHSGSWSKVLLHDDLGIVNQNSWTSFVNALTSGKFADFENIMVGNPGGTNPTAQFNGPQTALAFDLEGLDSHA